MAGHSCFRRLLCGRAVRKLEFLGPELPDVLSALVSMAALAVFLKFWKPKTAFRFAAERESAAAADRAPIKYGGAAVFKAWSPFLLLTAMISVWGIPGVKAALTGHYEGTSMWLSWLNAAGRALTFTPPVPFVNQQILQADGTPIEAVYKLELLGSAGTAILIAAVISKFALGMSWKTWGEAFIETVKELTLPVVTIVSVVGFAYVTNASGMSTTLGLSLAMTGAMFTFFRRCSAGSAYLLPALIHRPTYCSADCKK